MSLQASLGPLGLWISRALPTDERIRLSQVAEELGWGAVWTAGGISRGALDDVEPMLAATSRILHGTSILNMWAESPAEATAGFHHLEREFPGRFLLGVGPSHAPIVEKRGLGTYRSPLAKTREYIAGLESEATPVPKERLLLSALGPRALEVAAQHTAGTVPYLTVAEHTAAARQAVGPNRVVAPELGVVLTDDDDLGRDRARDFLASYLALPNYTTTMLRHGVAPADLDNGGSDQLIYRLFGVGSIGRIVAAIDRHREAGADHVAIQVLTLPDQDPATVMRAIAEAMA